MTINANDFGNTMFGVPSVLTKGEAQIICQAIESLWVINYGAASGPLASDLERCQMFFHPALRGQTLRNRIKEVQPAPANLARHIGTHLQPVVVHAGDGKFLIGVEARIVLELLKSARDHDHVIISSVDLLAAAELALGTYRNWARHRLDQVIALRTGQGPEVLQAPSVGVVLALLVNRSTSIDRAIKRPSDSTTLSDETHPIDDAIHSAAMAFADSVSTGRGRSSSEHRLTGGYVLSEARRRLGGQLVVTKPTETESSLLYISPEHRDDVVKFLASDLARRPTLSTEQLRVGFDRLSSVFRERRAQLARYRMVFERPADTSRLRTELLEAFAAARADKS